MTKQEVRAAILGKLSVRPGKRFTTWVREPGQSA